MDPITAVGLASAIISFVPLGIKVLQNAKEIKDSIDGGVKQNATRQAVIEELQALSGRLRVSQSNNINPPAEQVKLLDLASRCHDLSQQILNLLDKVRPKTSTTRGKYSSAVRVWLKEGEIKDLEKSLYNCREQLIVGLVDLSSQNSATYSAKILALIQTDSGKLDELRSQLDHLRGAIETITKESNENLLDQLTQLVRLNEDSLDKIYQHQILKSLKFDSMHERDDRVHNPHGDTFAWLFKDNEPPDTCRACQYVLHESLHQCNVHDWKVMMHQSRQRLANWLSSADGIFHVTGKLGSGKSTLMKYIYLHERTKVELKRWSGDKSLIVAGFFFWNPGTNLQRSISGLYRSLLHDILRVCPTEIPHALPQIWEQVKRIPWQSGRSLEISAEAIRAALEELFTTWNSRSDLFSNHRICLFIDGLDEHQEVSSQDHKYLASLLHKWVAISDGNLKMCVSSRDYNVFLNAFPEVDKQLLLPDLTDFDMREYVRSYLSHISGEKLRNYLTYEIPNRADGIFLWVILVTSEIRRQIENEVPDEVLEKVLDTIPRDLESLFRYVLSSLNEYDRKKAYQVMTILSLKEEDDYFQQKLLRLSLPHFSLLDEYNRDNEFSIQCAFPSSRLVARWKSTKPSTYQKWLRASCGGLVECRGEENYADMLDFSHRSIPEMLERPIFKQAMSDTLGHFDPIEAFCQLAFAEQQLSQLGQERKDYEVCGELANIRLMHDIDKAPYQFLEAMEAWLKYSFPKPDTNNMVLICTGRRSGYLAGFPYIKYLCESDSSKTGTGLDNKVCVYSALLLAVVRQAFDYVRWKIDRSLSSMGTEFEQSLLITLVSDEIVDPCCHTEDVDYFFDIGLLSHERDINNSIFGNASNVEYYKLDKHSVWERFLTSSFLCWCGFDVRSYYGDQEVEFDANRFSYIATQFLRSGAPTKFSVTIHGDEMEPLKSIFYFENILTIQFRPLPINPVRNPRVLPRHVDEARKLWYKPGGTKTLSLRQWVQSLDLEKKQALLELIDAVEGSKRDVKSGDANECHGSPCSNDPDELWAANTCVNTPPDESNNIIASRSELATYRLVERPSHFPLGLVSISIAFLALLVLWMK